MSSTDPTQDFTFGFESEGDDQSYSSVGGADDGRAGADNSTIPLALYIVIGVVILLVVVGIVIWCLRHRIAGWFCASPGVHDADMESASSASNTTSTALDSKQSEAVAIKDRGTGGNSRTVDQVDHKRGARADGKRGRAKGIDFSPQNNVTIVSEGAQQHYNRQAIDGTLMVKGVAPYLAEYPKSSKPGRMPGTIKDDLTKQ